MTHDEFIETFGVPEGWDLALAIQEQIDSYRRAARIVLSGVPPVVHPAAVMLFGRPSAEELIESARDRVRRPLIDLAAAREAAIGISESGGWGSFVPDPNHEMEEI